MTEQGTIPTAQAAYEADPVAHPKHYTSHPSGVECIQITEHMSFLRGNAVKYLWRADEKNGLEDLRKAAWYLDREIALRQGVVNALNEPLIRDPKKLIEMATQPAPATGKASRLRSVEPTKPGTKWTTKRGINPSASDLAARFLAYVSKHPGLRAEEVAKGLGAKKLPMVAIRNALGKKLILKGKRRGTRYFARGSK